MNSSPINVGMFGASFHEPNKGCEALGYSAVEMINRIAGEKNIHIKLFVYLYMPMKRFFRSLFRLEKFQNEYYPIIEYENITVNIVFMLHTRKHLVLPGNLHEMDYIIDYTGGDSFSDIYGISSFQQSSSIKLKIIKMGIPLILGSQTIGPFYNEEAKLIANKIINNCKEVFVRDELSEAYLAKEFHRNPVLGTDVAFGLPYKRGETFGNNSIGINVSGLLWADCKNGNKRFGLKVNYKDYVYKLLDMLINKGYEVHIILHAYDKDGSNPSDNDYIPYREIKDDYPNIVYAPLFRNCIEAKDYIARLALLVAARMHASIAAISADIPVIPFSYSRKFEGLYNSIGYPYVIGGLNLDTDSAVHKTMEWIEAIDELKMVAKGANLVATEKLTKIRKKMGDILIEQGDEAERLL